MTRGRARCAVARAMPEPGRPRRGAVACAARGSAASSRCCSSIIVGSLVAAMRVGPRRASGRCRDHHRRGRRASCSSLGCCADASAPHATSTGWSTRPVGSRTATTGSGSAGPRSDLAADPGARPRLRHDGRPARDRRGAAPQRCSPTSATSCARRCGHHRQSRGDRRRGLPARRRPTSRRSSTRPASSSRLIDDLRTIALSEAGTLPLHPGADRPGPARRRRRRARSDRRPRRPPWRSPRRLQRRPADPRDRPVRIREVLSNLVANALRHTPAGGRVTIGGAVEGVVARPERRGHRARDRSSAAPARLRPLRQGHRLARLRTGAGDRARARGGPRRDDLGRFAGRWRDDVPVRPAARYGRVTRTSSTAASTVLDAPTSPASKTIRTRLAGPRGQRHADRGPVRVVEVGGSELLTDERAGPVLALDPGPEVVLRRRVRAVGEVVAERQLAERRRQR